MKRVSFAVDGETVRGVLHEPPGMRRSPVPLVILAHGMNSSRKEWFEFPERLAQGGYAVFAFDFRGHGESDGERGVQSSARAREDLEAAIGALAAEYNVDTKKLAIIGHSLGAGLALAAAPHLPITCLIAMAPPHLLRQEMASAEYVGYNAMRAVNLLVRPFSKMGIRVPYKVEYKRLYADPKALHRAEANPFLDKWVPVKNYKALVSELDGVKSARRVKVPTLVLVAEYDVVIGKYNSRRVYEALAGPKRFVEVPRSGHSMAGDGRAEFVATQCLEFLDAHLKRPPP